MAPQDLLAALLGEMAAPGTFSARETAPVDDLDLEVRGVGRVVLPVSAQQAQQLCGVGRPAAYGLKDQTLLDARVRDTWEIPLTSVTINQQRWRQTLTPVLDRLRAGLGLPSGCLLKAELQSMLVYGPGQFFVPHQDSEKTDAMVGSLVVSLPSSFTGGSFLVRHAGASASYRSPRKDLSFVAFYADCVHEVRPVTSGYRLTLTYNLLLQGDAAPAVAPAGLVDPVAACLREYFEAPAQPTRATAASPGPRRLAYLLDHEYTARGLSWSRLKGPDRARAATMRAAAARAGCEVVLALADIHETWDCNGPESESAWYGGREWRPDAWDEDVDGEDPGGSGQPGEGSYHLESLIDSDVTLVAWIDNPQDSAIPLSLAIPACEVCASLPSAELAPYASEFEGYMGNYGNTMDRWYHRAAVVVWPQGLAFAARAEASPPWALDTLLTVLSNSGLGEARQLTDTLNPFWSRVGVGVPQGSLGTALRVAGALDDADRAAMLLAPLRVEMVGQREAPVLAALAASYGEGWVGDLFRRWFAAGRRWGPMPAEGPGRAEWVASLVGLCTALQRSGESGLSAGRAVLAASWGWLGASVGQALAITAPSRREEALGQLGRPIAAVLLSGPFVGARELVNEVLDHLCTDTDDLTGCLIEVVRSARELAPDGDAGATRAVEDFCHRRLTERLAIPPRASDDWSVKLPAGCSCELCARLEAFLSDPARSSLDWPLATDGRRHVHARIDGAELPVRHETRRRGRPYTLVLNKTEALFERDRQRRVADQADLAWLTARFR